jgi:hypothetical protein
MDKEPVLLNAADAYDDDNYGESEDPTYEDICCAVRQNVQLPELKEMLNDYSYEHQHNIDTMDEMVYNIWSCVIRPYIEETGYMKYNSYLEIQRSFTGWLHANSNLGRRIDYITKLQDAVDRYLEDGPTGAGVRPGDGIVAGDERQ